MLQLCASPLRALHGAPGNFNFRITRSARKILNRMAILVARFKVHPAKIASLAQNLVHQANALKEGLPIKRRRQPHAGDDVAHRHAHRGLFLMLRPHHFVCGRALRGKSLVEPQQNWPNSWVEVPQSLDELHRKGSVQRFAFEASENSRRRYGWGTAGSEKAI